MSQPIAIVIGAGSAIGRAILAELQNTGEYSLLAFSRRQPGELDTPLDGQLAEDVHWQQVDYTDESIAAACRDLTPHAGQVARVFICNGQLHGDDFNPEKKLDELQPDTFIHLINSNALVPVLWLKHLLPIIKGDTTCVVTAFSARVGSISDNQLGGWYSYRASKATLNMLMQTAAVEMKRRAKNVKLLAFHPGTTDTPLSKPFQARVPEGKLFTPEFVAGQLGGIVNGLEPDGKLSYLDWDNQPISF